MRRVSMMGGVAALLIGSSLGMMAAPAAATLAPAAATLRSLKPGPPTSAVATSHAGVRGINVTWSPPVSGGGPQILFYWVANGNGKHHCQVYVPAPLTCQIPAIGGSFHSLVTVTAYNALGHGPRARVQNAVLRASTPPANSNPTSPPSNPTPSSGGGSEAAGSTLATQLPATGGGSTSTEASGTPITASSSDSSTLPFTGVNLATFLVTGVGLVLLGLLLMSTFRQKRWAARLTERFLFGD